MARFQFRAAIPNHGELPQIRREQSQWKGRHGGFGSGLLAGSVVAILIVHPNSPVRKSIGDVFVSTDHGEVLEYSPEGKLRRTLKTGMDGTVFGSAFDKEGGLYVTEYYPGRVFKFEPHSEAAKQFGPDYEHRPESISIDASGNIYVGVASDDPHEPDAETATIAHLNPQGELTTYTVRSEKRGADWIDLASDQHTIYYTSEGSQIKRFDIRANNQMPVFSNAGTELFALRILPDGRILVANSENVLLLDATGKVVRSDLTGKAQGQGFFAVNLDPDGVSYWTVSYEGSTIYRVSIDTGGVISQFETNRKPYGLSIYGERRMSAVGGPK